MKYKLWKECQYKCPYSGSPIPVEKLFTNEVQIEHIIPYSRSLDDSFMNKTLCYDYINKEKGKRTPFEYYSSHGIEAWTEAKQRALSIFYDNVEFSGRYNKFKRFATEKFNDVGFISRQLNDTRYLSVEAKNYLSLICKNINVPTGQHTSNLRHKWGLNSILSKSDEKERDDHRHHAIDALVVTCMDKHYMQELSRWNSYDKNNLMKDFPHPWSSFYSDAEKSISEILVSFARKSKVIVSRKTKTVKSGIAYINEGKAARGQLHKETVYGKRKSLDDNQYHYHIKKPLEQIKTKKHIDKIVDPVIRQLIREHVNKKGEFNFFTQVDGQKMPLIFLPNKKGDDVPVRKVRVKEEKSNAELLHGKKDKGAVDPRSNHHVLICENREGQITEDILSFWTVVERKLQGQPVYQHSDTAAQPLAILSTNEMFVVGLSNEEFEELQEDFAGISPYLYRIQKISSWDYNFRHHLSSTLEISSNHKLIRIRSGKSWIENNPIPVTVDTSGRLKKLKYDWPVNFNR